MTVTAERNRVQKKSILEIALLPEEILADGQVLMIGATEGVAVPCGDNDNPIGIAQRSISAALLVLYDIGRRGNDDIRVPLMTVGIAMVRCGEALPMNSWVRSDADGRVVQATLDERDNIIGINLNATTEAGESTHILVHRIPATDEMDDHLLLDNGEHLLFEDDGLIIFG